MTVNILVKKLFKFLGVDLEIRIWSDRTAANQASSRLGIEKMRHLGTQYLWIQELVKLGQVTLHKIPGEKNPSDIFTKDVPKDVIFEAKEIRCNRLHHHHERNQLVRN